MRRWLALVCLTGCLTEEPLAPETPCTKGTANCPCSDASQCHDGTALGYARFGWYCDGGLCKAFQCKSKYDCGCSSANATCNAGLCQCK